MTRSKFNQILSSSRENPRTYGLVPVCAAISFFKSPTVSSELFLAFSSGALPASEIVYALAFDSDCAFRTGEM